MLAVLTAVSIASCAPSENSREPTDSVSQSAVQASQPEKQPAEEQTLSGWTVQDTPSLSENASSVYYLNQGDLGAVYCLDKASMTSQKIYGGSPSSLRVTESGDLLFMEGMNLYRLKAGSTEPELLAGNCENLYFADSSAAYYGSAYTLTLYRYDFATGEIHTAEDASVSRLAVTPYGILYARNGEELAFTSLDAPFAESQTVYKGGTPTDLYYADGAVYFISLEMREQEGAGGHSILYAYNLKTQELDQLDNLGPANCSRSIGVKDGKLYYFHTDAPEKLDVMDLTTLRWSSISLAASDYTDLQFADSCLFASTARTESGGRMDILGYDGASQQVSGHLPVQPPQADPESSGEGTDSHHTPSIALNNGVFREWSGVADMTQQELSQYGVTLEQVQAMVQEMAEMDYSIEDIRKLDPVITLLGGTPE